MEASALHLAWLKSAIPPNVGNSGVQFLIVGDCVRAIPCQISEGKEKGSLALLTVLVLARCAMLPRVLFLKHACMWGKGVHGEWDLESDSLTYCH